MLPPTVAGLADVPTGAEGSCGTPAGAGCMPVSGGTAPIGWPALGSAAGGGVAGVAGLAEAAPGSAGVAGVAGVAPCSGGGGAPVAGGCVEAGMSCAIAIPVTPVPKASMAAPANRIDFIGIILSLFSPRSAFGLDKEPDALRLRSGDGDEPLRSRRQTMPQ